jgi:hypothetical protein
MGNALWSKLLSESLTRHVGETAAREIMEGCTRLEELDENSRAECVKRVIDRLDSRVHDDEAKISIMTDCACQCYAEHLEQLRDEYRKSRDVDRLLDAMHGKVFLLRPTREGDIVYVTKVPRFPEEHRRAETAEAKKYYFCHCDHARAVHGEISLTYCYCGAGWCKRIWEGVLERPVRVDIVESVLQGDDVCRFAVHL